MDTGTWGEDHMKVKAETGWCSRNRGHRCLWVTAEAGRETWTVCGALLQQPEEANENGNSILPAALRQTPQTHPLVHPHPTHLQSGTTSHLQLHGFRPAPRPGTQPTSLTQSACSSSLFFRWHPNHCFEICQVASLQFSNPTHPCHVLQNGQNLSNGGHGTSFGPSRRFHPHHPWAQTQFQLHQSHLCSARSISKTTAHQGFVLALPSKENSLSHLPTPMMSFGPKYLHYWLAPFPQVTCRVSPRVHTQHLPLASCFFHGPVFLILSSFPEPPPATQPTGPKHMPTCLPTGTWAPWGKGPSLLQCCTQWMNGQPGAAENRFPLLASGFAC